MRESAVKKILGEYSLLAVRLADAGMRAEMLLRELLVQRNLRIHSVSHRVKEEKSLEQKLIKPGSKYRKINDIKDLLGIRIITYFQDDVDRVGNLIEEQFTVDRENSIDRRATLDPDRFGYLSLHYVVTFSAGRLRLPEYSRFSSISFEIQVRSILQHAWAEIEHDLGYKTERSIPRAVRRRFSRLAGLLEVADSEFLAIRNELVAYQNTVEKTVSSNPSSTLIDRDSVTAFIQSNGLVQELDNDVAKAGQSYINEKEPSLYLASLLQGVGLGTISDIEHALQLEKRRLVPFARAWWAVPDWEDQGEAEMELMDDLANTGFSPGISLFYLAHMLIAKTRSATRVEAYLNEFSIGMDSERRFYAHELIKAYEKAQHIAGP
jgi:putative GTP pyrophosphokinase